MLSVGVFLANRLAVGASDLECLLWHLGGVGVLWLICMFSVILVVGARGMLTGIREHRICALPPC